MVSFTKLELFNPPVSQRLVHRHYLVIYRLHEAARLVEIVRVWDGRQNPTGLELP